MNNVGIKLHPFQAELIKKLATVTKLKFKDLNIEGLESEHMNYHLKKIQDFGLVEKVDDFYNLTDSGKDYSNLMDDDIEFIEKQPKSSVLLAAVRINPTTNEVEHLLSKRLRQPYFGKVGRLTGKIKFGETIVDAAKRELFEETGLEADTFILEEIYHKLRRKDDGTYVQDVIFYRFFITDIKGTLIKKTPHQENIWVTVQEFKEAKYDFFDDLSLSNRTIPKELKVTEDVAEADGF